MYIFLYLCTQLEYVIPMSTNRSLKEIIKEKGYRIDYVADQVGLNAATLRLIAGGHRKTSRPVLKLLSQILSVSEDELVRAGILSEEAG